MNLCLILIQSFKEEIQVKLKQVLKEHKITTIIVTHDSYEAFYLGNKCGIIFGRDNLNNMTILIMSIIFLIL